MEGLPLTYNQGTMSNLKAKYHKLQVHYHELLLAKQDSNTKQAFYKTIFSLVLLDMDDFKELTVIWAATIKRILCRIYLS